MFNWRPCISAVLLQYEILQKEYEKSKKEVRCLLSCCPFIHPLFLFSLNFYTTLVCGLKGIVYPKIKENILKKYIFQHCIDFYCIETENSVIFTHLYSPSCILLCRSVRFFQMFLKEDFVKKGCIFFNQNGVKKSVDKKDF